MEGCAVELVRSRSPRKNVAVLITPLVNTRTLTGHVKASASYDDIIYGLADERTDCIQ
jgi:hypothetical protein